MQKQQQRSQTWFASLFEKAALTTALLMTQNSLSNLKQEKDYCSI